MNHQNSVNNNIEQTSFETMKTCQLTAETSQSLKACTPLRDATNRVQNTSIDKRTWAPKKASRPLHYATNGLTNLSPRVLHAEFTEACAFDKQTWAPKKIPRKANASERLSNLRPRVLFEEFEEL